MTTLEAHKITMEKKISVETRENLCEHMESNI